MRLEKIKLAGFKSFVDPTTVSFPSNLVGVVGPNGCGKSNVIDAVRWVMGESSAKMLRGESMADVIFNGSTSRKPVGTASIELLFDNSDGGAGGQYAQYSNISVKRQVSRDGQSHYYLNGVRCRRRDITDLFLGTGLGPRSYSIIEQGMISRIIESKPEELRVYLEEAAGISKYKERRRETENRIRHTRENLDRLNDLREEIQKQLHHLERQAKTAEKYKELKKEERVVSGELLLLRLNQMTQDLKAKDEVLVSQQNRLEAAVADQREVESRIEKQREAHHLANENFNNIQGEFYSVGADIARLQEAIQFAKESKRQQEVDFEQAERSLNQAKQHHHEDSSKLATLAMSLDKDQPELDSARENEQKVVEQRSLAEQQMAQWQTEWDDFNQRATAPAQAAQVERSRLNQLEQQETQANKRLERLREEQERLNDIQLQAEINELGKAEQEAQENVSKLVENTQNAVNEINQLRGSYRENQQKLSEQRSLLAKANGRKSSLVALQQAALGSDEKQLKRWVGDRGLADHQRLLAKLNVEKRWQTSVEVVLSELLQSICVDDMNPHASALQQLNKGYITLFQDDGKQVAAIDGRLAGFVKAPGQINALLNKVRVAEDIQQALEIRSQLADDESVITDNGIWMGPGWLRYQAGSDAQAGMLAREQALRELDAELDAIQEAINEFTEAVEQGQKEVANAERLREENQQEINRQNKALAELRHKLSGKRARAEQVKQRTQELKNDAEEIQKQIKQSAEDMSTARSKLHQALADMETLSEQREKLVAIREQHQQALAKARQDVQSARDNVHNIALRVESMRSSEQSLRDGLQRMQGQFEQLESRCSQLRESIDSATEPMLKQEKSLEERLEVRLAVEEKLGLERKQLEAIDHDLRELDKKRHQIEQLVQQEREKLDAQRLSRQEVLVRSQNIDEQLSETGLEITELQSNLSENANIQEWQELSSKLANRIQRLGAINLAAIDEFKEQSERMEYLDKQAKDVNDSLETLENAIQKIDKETRGRFRNTFDKVNTGLQAMFPKLFGGGHAYLELTGEDLLDAGVAIMARPPGKRNSSIHLLSGGEKALSAVALVFSIFQLNPAPFCMLDEVDAPLDDANVGRFCALVKEMSETVQFIFITHNKVTMEISHQLSGVTMSEPGVSRIVSVDIEEAAQMAAL